MAPSEPLEFGRVLGSAGTRTGFMLSIVGDDFARRAREVLADHGLQPRQLRILDLLADRGPIGQRELAALMGIDHSILVTLLNPLEADRMVKRERDTTDRRRHNVTITAAGQRHLDKADKAFRTAEDDFFALLTAEQREQLGAVLTLLREGKVVQAPGESSC